MFLCWTFVIDLNLKLMSHTKIAMQIFAIAISKYFFIESLSWELPTLLTRANTYHSRVDWLFILTSKLICNTGSDILQIPLEVIYYSGTLHIQMIPLTSPWKVIMESFIFVFFLAYGNHAYYELKPKSKSKLLLLLLSNMLNMK